jgi:saccharopine dehydrogenase (NADP+, L-glutamate forming)
MENVSEMTHEEFLGAFLDLGPSLSVEAKVCKIFGLTPDSGEIQRLRWSGLFSEEKIGLTEGSPAHLLEHILNKKWKLAKGDKDFIVMWHRFGYEVDGERKTITSNLSVAGENEVETAMARTVGLPLGIAAKLLLEGKVKQRGVVIPTARELYDPLLAELSTLGISLVENGEL